MTLFQEVIRLSPTSPELENIRVQALAGDHPALKKYVYYGALQEIRRDKSIPPKEKMRTFRKLVKADLIEVSLG